MATHSLRSTAPRSIANIHYVEAPELYNWIKQGHARCNQPFQVIDVRGSDYIGGHIKNGWNMPYRRTFHDQENIDSLKRRLFTITQGEKQQKDGTRTLNVVFHCARSMQRGPSAAVKFLRSLSDDEFAHCNVWVLRGGFNHWQDVYGRDSSVTEDYRPELWEW